MTKDKQKRFADLATTKFVADILMVGELERFISKAQIALQENGMYKQQVKRQMNELIKCNRMLFGNVQDAEAQWYTPIYTKCFPYYAKKFTGDGMSVARQMQAAFIAETKDRSQMLYINYKQLIDKHGIAHSEVRALLYTISALSRITRRISERIYEQMEIVLYNRVVNKHPQRVNDKIEHCVKEILKTIGAGDFSIEKEEFKPIREYIEGITKSLISDDAAKLVCKVIEQFSYGYVDYCIAQMVIDAHGKALPEDVQSDLKEMLGVDCSDWDAFLMSIDVDDDDDAIDVIERLPKDNSLLTHVAQTLLQRLPYVEELKDVK